MRRTLDEKKNELEPADYNDQKPDFKLGQYKVIMKLVETIGKDGELIKAEVDDAIDRCPHMQNLRECIQYTKEMYDKETDDRRKFWKRMAINFIERYFYLVLFNAYLREIGRPPQTKKAKKKEDKGDDEEKQEEPDEQEDEAEKNKDFIPFATTFSKWHADHPQLYSLLGNRESGALADFSWV